MSDDEILIYCVRDGRIEHFQQRDLFLPSFHAVSDCKLFVWLQYNRVGELRGER